MSFKKKIKVQYIGSDKKRYQLEVPESASKKAGNGYEIQNQRKGFKRFTTARTKVSYFNVVVLCCVVWFFNSIN